MIRYDRPAIIIARSARVVFYKRWIIAMRSVVIIA